MNKLKNISRSSAVLLVKKLFTRKETGVMKKYSSSTGLFKHIAKKLIVKIQRILINMIGLKLQGLCLEGMIRSVNSNIIRTNRLALTR